MPQSHACWAASESDIRTRSRSCCVSGPERSAARSSVSTPSRGNHSSRRVKWSQCSRRASPWLARSPPWKLATGGDHGLALRPVERQALQGVPTEVSALTMSEDSATQTARKAIVDTVQAACQVDLEAALDLQAKHSADFMTTSACRKGRVGAEYSKTMLV